MEEAPTFASALLKYQIDRDGSVSNDRLEIAINDKALVAQLAACFPALGTRRDSPIAGGWFPGVLVFFYRVNGTVVRILIDPAWRSWTEGSGDWKVRPGTRELIESLVNHRC